LFGKLCQRETQDTRKEDARYLDACRKKRNIVEYDYTGAASESDADELIAFAVGFRADVMAWLETKHPDLVH
jgi:hypothetical protein